jgi:copper chaperone CopZ
MTVSENLKKLPGVKQVQVDVADGQVKIFSAKKSDLKSDSVKAIVEKSGYTFNSLQPHCN